VVDSVEKKWVLGWKKKGFADRKNADVETFPGCLQKA
jgi:ribonuclease HI